MVLYVEEEEKKIGLRIQTLNYLQKLGMFCVHLNLKRLLRSFYLDWIRGRSQNHVPCCPHFLYKILILPYCTDENLGLDLNLFGIT